ncbi:MAG: hypothetical protein E6J89_11205 [Deltaproteobacteria bacterium]|nr:MAG: hypothetical protein E6J89_11205 [Deltaproteobacteria bacterium]
MADRDRDLRQRGFEIRSFWLGLFCLSLSLSLSFSGCGGGERAETDRPAPQGVPGKEEALTPVTGDWLLNHSLSDPEQLNPLTSNDASASEVLNFIFETLLQLDPRTLELRPLLAEARPEISKDKLTYTFKIRRDVRFSDGRPVTGEDVLFSVKAIKCPLVDAPFLRVYYDSVVDAELLDPYTIRFKTKEQYFLNEQVLGEITVLSRHFYDPDNLLQNVGGSLARSQTAPRRREALRGELQQQLQPQPRRQRPLQVRLLEDRAGSPARPRPELLGQREGRHRPAASRPAPLSDHQQSGRRPHPVEERRPRHDGPDADSSQARHEQRTVQKAVRKIRILQPDLFLRRLEQSEPDLPRQARAPGDDLFH